MKTTFAATLQLCGLSQAEAADYLGVRLDTVKSWSAGRNPVPDGVWSMLAALWQRIEDAADDASASVEPDILSLRRQNHIEADSAADPLPGDGPAMAGAMALLFAILEAGEG